MRNLLFTPGPLTTSESTKEAMLHDAGSRDRAFIATIREVRQKLLSIAGVAAAEYEVIPMQGSGTFGIEAVLSSCVPASGKLLVAVNGAYGRRMVDIARRLGIPIVAVRTRILTGQFPRHRRGSRGGPRHHARRRDSLRAHNWHGQSRRRDWRDRPRLWSACDRRCDEQLRSSPAGLAESQRGVRRLICE